MGPHESSENWTGWDHNAVYGGSLANSVQGKRKWTLKNAPPKTIWNVKNGDRQGVRAKDTHPQCLHGVRLGYGKTRDVPGDDTTTLLKKETPTPLVRGAMDPNVTSRKKSINKTLRTICRSHLRPGTMIPGGNQVEKGGKAQAKTGETSLRKGLRQKIREQGIT